LFLRSIERKRIGTYFRTPEGFLKTDSKLGRLSIEHISEDMIPQASRDARCELLGHEYIALHFRERDRSLRQLPVGMEDGVMRVLPTLIGEPLVGLGTMQSRGVTKFLVVSFQVVCEGVVRIVASEIGARS
jgi:hypothetical protein